MQGCRLNWVAQQSKSARYKLGIPSSISGGQALTDIQRECHVVDSSACSAVSSHSELFSQSGVTSCTSLPLAALFLSPTRPGRQSVALCFSPLLFASFFSFPRSPNLIFSSSEAGCRSSVKIGENERACPSKVLRRKKREKGKGRMPQTEFEIDARKGEREGGREGGGNTKRERA